MVLHVLNPSETDTAPRKTLLVHGSDMQLRLSLDLYMYCALHSWKQTDNPWQCCDAHFPLSRQTSFEEGRWETRAAFDVVKNVIPGSMLLVCISWQ